MSTNNRDGSELRRDIRIAYIPKVSVIIPTYNRADLIKEAISSVLNQSYQNFEIIVVDDGSTDNTSEVITSFNDSRIKYLYQKHTGLPAAGRNLGMQKSSGDYIAFLDSDDIWLPEKLEKQIHYLQKHPQYCIVYSNAWVIDISGSKKRLFLKHKMLKEGSIFGDLIKLNFVPIFSVLMKREVFEKVGLFNEASSLRAIEDYEYWLRAALHFEFGFINEPLAMYRDHSEALGKKTNNARLRQRVLTFFLESPSIPEKYKECMIEIKNKLYLNSAVYFLRNHELALAKEDILRYIIYYLKCFRARRRG